MPDCTGRPSTGPASTVRVKGEVGPWKDWRLYLPVVKRVLEADIAVFKHEGGDRATIVIERGENGWRVKPINVTFPCTCREQLEKALALTLHPNKWKFTLELKINTSTPLG